MSRIDVCPRCGEKKLEHFESHSSCLECQYSPDIDGWIDVDDELFMNEINNEDGELNFERGEFL